MFTKGQRRIGRTIRKLENNVELSSKESYAKKAETKYKTTKQSTSKNAEDPPVQNLRDIATHKKYTAKTET